MGDTQEKIWIEKFRPSTFDEIKGQDKIVERVKAFVNQRSIPHMLFSGPSGSGKTTLALVLAKTLFKDNWRQNFYETNASDSRGIDTIRNEIKEICRIKAIGTDLPKIIFLDESDALTKEAQNALRRMMEQYTSSARFVLSCVTPETKILLPEEVEINIGDFTKYFENKKISNITNINISTKSEKDQVLACVSLNPRTIEKKVLEITTMTGRKLKVTEDHRLLTNKGWIDAGNLNKTYKLLMYPHLEDTYFEEREEKVFDLNEFIEFLSEKEKESGYKDINDAKSFGKLRTLEKAKILNKARVLYDEIKSNKGLTEREYDVYNIIKTNKGFISRKDIQNKIKLSRIRVVQLLKEIENKGFIERAIGKNKHVHYFKINNNKPKLLRNFVHIKRIIEREYDLKISYTAVKKSLNKNIERGSVERVVKELKEKDLLNISYNDSKIGSLSRIVAFMLGDGHLVRNNIGLIFTGNEKALNEVKKDLKILGYEGSKIYTKTINNKINGRKVIGNTTFFYLNSKALSLFLQYLGVPVGDKVSTSYNVPKFVRLGTRFVKREFLRSFFGCEGDKLNWRRGYCFEAIKLSQNKIRDLEGDMIDYFNEIKNLLNEFNVESYIKVHDLNEKRKKDNKEVLRFVLILRSSNENIFLFLSRVGYCYEKYKMSSARIASEYLRHKQFMIQLQKQKALQVIKWINDGESNSTISKELDCTLDFIADRIELKEVKLAYSKFCWFDKWKNKYDYKNGFIWNEIYDIKEVNADEVMDISCFSNHNFISNGFVSHNCNYSSKIIDPIQSRCTIFRFKPLEKKDIEKIIENIAKSEKLKIDKKAVDALYEISNGDVRRMENVLQSCSVISKKIDENLIYEIVSAAKPKEIKEVLELCINKNFIKARDLLLQVMLKHGLSGIDIIKQIQKEILNLNIKDEKKLEMIERCGEIEFRLVEGSDEFIQLESLLAAFSK